MRIPLACCLLAFLLFISFIFLLFPSFDFDLDIVFSFCLFLVGIMLSPRFRFLP